MGFSGRALICATLALAVAHLTHAQNTPKDYLDLHNAARAEAGVAPVSWNETVAAYAEQYAQQRTGDCELIHSGGPYGENIFAGWGYEFAAADAVNDWVAEKKYYDYDSNSCIQGQQCLHYTQVMWAQTTSIGCARAKCSTGDSSYFITCNYSPPGNYIGQRPF